MSRNYIVILIFALFFASCATFSMKTKQKSKSIKLQELTGSQLLKMQNKVVKLIVDIKDVQEILNTSNNKSTALSDYLDNEIKDILEIPINNLQIKNDIQDDIFPIIYELLLKGRAEVYDLKQKVKLETIEYIYINDISGEQELFILNNKEIFYTKVISLGE